VTGGVVAEAGIDTADFPTEHQLPPLAETFRLVTGRFGRSLVVARDVEALQAPPALPFPLPPTITGLGMDPVPTTRPSPT
jgi:hypothetical protein